MDNWWHNCRGYLIFELRIKCQRDSNLKTVSTAKVTLAAAVIFFTIPNHAKLLEKQQIEWNFRTKTDMELSSAFKDCTDMPKLLILSLQPWEQKGLFHWLLARSVHRQPRGVNYQSDLLPAVPCAVPAHTRTETAATAKQSVCIYQEQWGNSKSLTKTLRNVYHPNLPRTSMCYDDTFLN